MYNIGKFLFDGVMIASTLWIVKIYLGVFCKKRKWNIRSASAWILFFVFQIYVQMNCGMASIWITIVSIILVILIALTGYNGKGKMIFLEVLFLYAVWSLVEMTIFFCMNLLPLEMSDAVMVGAVISKILMIIVVYFFSIIWKKRSNDLLPAKYYIGLFFVPAGSIYIAVNEFYAKNNTKHIILSMITFSILLLFNIIIWEINLKMSDFFLLERENAVYIQQINIMSTSTEEQKKMMENFHRERHDLINKLIIIRSGLENNDKDEVIKNIDGIIQNQSTEKVISNSGNRAIDSLINFKYAIAKEKGIKFILKIFIPEDLPINQCDIGVVLGNILDNAIEATEKCESDKRKIEVIIGIRKEALVIVVKNPYEGVLQMDRTGNLLSTKEDSNRHGYGIGSVRKVVERYSGDVIIDEEYGQFVMTVTMNLGDFNS